MSKRNILYKCRFVADSNVMPAAKGLKTIMTRPAMIFESVLCAAMPTTMPMILALAKRATDNERSCGVELTMRITPAM